MGIAAATAGAAGLVGDYCGQDGSTGGGSWCKTAANGLYVVSVLPHNLTGAGQCTSPMNGTQSLLHAAAAEALAGYLLFDMTATL